MRSGFLPSQAHFETLITATLFSIFYHCTGTYY
jgi:CCR4-NOT transcriptional regulation complex NOT5 subunit